MRRAAETSNVAAALCALVAVSALAIGCGGTNTSTPHACLSGPGAYLRGLRAAPGNVTLRDGTPISGCLVPGQKAGELATVGSSMLSAVTTLNAQARRQPGGSANLRLGYLIGAAKRGAEGSEGIHSELLRRLTAAAAYSPRTAILSPEFEATYREGFAAGHARG
jgi:hypothetical protein